MAKKPLKKRLHLLILVFIFVILFVVLFILSSLSGLRFFVPNYFSFAGGPFSEKNYLVLFQDNNELNPSGGFVSAYGILKFKNSIYQGIDVYETDVFGDTDYYGDFSKTVPELLKTLSLTDSATIFDGVMAINTKTFEDIIKILEYEEAGDPGFTSEIIKKTIFSPLKWRDLSDMVVKNLNEKHIQLQFFSSSFQKKINEKGWSGDWPGVSGDFLALVETNLSGTKSNRYINRDIKYRLYLGEKLTGKVTVDVEHFGTYNAPISEPYSGYFQLYMPSGTRLKNSNVNVQTENSNNFSIFGTNVNLKAGETKTLIFNIELPETIFDDSNYHLDIIKQAGTIEDTYSIVVEAPEMTTVQSNDFETRENYAIWESNLLRDTSLDLQVLR